MKKTLFLMGLRDGIPIATGYFAVSFSFGIAAVAAGLAPFEALLISMTNLTSAGQFAAIGIITGGGSYIEMALSQLVINMRYALMSLSLSQKLDRSFTRLQSLILGHAVTDEIFAVAMSRSGRLRPIYFLGLAALPYIGWFRRHGSRRVFWLPDARNADIVVVRFTLRYVHSNNSTSGKKGTSGAHRDAHSHCA